MVRYYEYNIAKRLDNKNKPYKNEINNILFSFQKSVNRNSPMT